MKLRIRNEENQRLALERKGGKSIYVEYKSAAPWPDHWHSYFEIEIVVKGTGKHTIAGDSYEVSEGSAYILTPTDFHRMEPNGELMVWNVSFSEAAISNARLCQLTAKDRERTFKLGAESLERIVKLLEIMKDESARDESESCLRELCECLLCLLMRERGEVLIRDEDRYSRIKDAIMYIENHFTESPTLNQVASRIGLHPHYFSDLFHKVTGKSFCEYLNSLRIGYAKTLLSKGYSVSEACFGSGFGSISNFIYRFKKEIGVSPKQFKEQRSVT